MASFAMEELKTSRLGVQNKSLHSYETFFWVYLSNLVGWDGGILWQKDSGFKNQTESQPCVVHEIQ